MVKSKRVPDILIQWTEKTKTLQESEKMLETLMEAPEDYSEEIEYMQESIRSLDIEMNSDREEVDRLLNSIRFDTLAMICARLHYFCALPWDEVSYIIGNDRSTEAIKARVYRAFANANTEKAIRRIAQLSDEI